MNRLRLRTAIALLLPLLALAGGACGGDNDGGGTAQPGATGTTGAGPAATTTTVPLLQAPTTAGGGPRIVIQSFAFSGTDSIKALSPITVENKDQANHTVSSTENKFAAMAVGPGETKVFPSLPAGTYAIRCDIHPSRMTGTLVVA